MLCNGWDKINLYLILMPTIGSIFHVQITVTEITELKDICPGDIIKKNFRYEEMDA